MTEETTTSASETPNDVTSIGETPDTSSASETLETIAPDDLAKEIERLKASLKRANNEAKQYREKASELDTLKKQTENEKLSETERLQNELATLKAQQAEAIQAQTERAIRHEVAIEAAKLGVDPAHLDRVARFLDWEEIDIDESGNPTNVRDLVAQLVKEFPGLKTMKATAPTSGGATNPSRTQTTAMPDITDEYIASLTPETYNALPAEQKVKISNYRATHTYRYGRKN